MLPILSPRIFNGYPRLCPLDGKLSTLSKVAGSYSNAIIFEYEIPKLSARRQMLRSATLRARHRRGSAGDPALSNACLSCDQPFGLRQAARCLPNLIRGSACFFCPPKHVGRVSLIARRARQFTTRLVHSLSYIVIIR
jgi:hypothetical protein